MQKLQEQKFHFVCRNWRPQNFKIHANIIYARLVLHHTTVASRNWLLQKSAVFEDQADLRFELAIPEVAPDINILSTPAVA